MPNKYEREIEEILRNMDRTEPKPGLGNRIRAFNRPRPRRPRRLGTFGLTACEVFLLSGILVILFAAGLRYFFGTNQPTFGFLAEDALTGFIALLGFVLFVVGLVIGWRSGFSGGGITSTNWRSTTNYNNVTSRSDSGSASENKVVRMQTRRRRNPFSGIATQIRILRLKMRYQRIRDHDDSENSRQPRPR
jgi:hypothetical protein